MAKIKRSLVKTFLNTNTVISPTWSLIGSGVTSAAIQYNPKVTEEHYISDDNASLSVDSYAPTMPVEATCMNGDAVWEFIELARLGRDTLDSAETEVVNVWLYETPAMTYYEAEKQDVSLQVDTFGGEGGVANKVSYTINYMGEHVPGTFSPTALAFYPRPVNTILTTLSIGGLTLTPDFAVDKGWIWYELSVPNATSLISMSSTLAGATITQYDEATPVSQGADATLAVGINHLTVEVTVGSETTIYSIDVTRAAA